MKGRVAVLKAYGGEFELREYPVPDPEPGAILIKLTRAGVCGSDLHIWRGEMKETYGALPKDLTFGHEMCGRVERLGAGVTTDSMGRPLREGDRVTFCYFFPCGRCPVCLHDEMGSCPQKGRPNRVAGTAPYFNNAYGDYYYLRPDHFIFKLPDEIPDDVATPINCALSQVLYGLRKAGFRAGQSLVVQGAGGLGVNAVAVARDMGADRVIVVDRLAERLALAKSFGADHTVNASEINTADKRVDAVMDLTDGFGADVVADFVGYADVIPEGLRMLRGGGCYLEVGSDLARQRVLLRRDRARARQHAPRRHVQLLAVGARAVALVHEAQSQALPVRPRDLPRVPARAHLGGLRPIRLGAPRRRPRRRLPRRHLDVI